VRSGNSLISTLALALTLLCAGAGCAPPAEVIRPDELKLAVPGADTLVVVYSRSGNTAQMARAFAKVLGADYQRILPLNGQPGTYLSVPVWTDPQPFSPEKIDLAPYRLVLIGGPMWNWHPNAVTTSFIQASDFTGKDVVLFYTFQGGVMSSLTETTYKQLVTDRGGRVIDLVAINRKTLSADTTVAAEAERIAKERISKWRPALAAPAPAK
jgi:flavodoxin